MPSVPQRFDNGGMTSSAVWDMLTYIPAIPSTFQQPTSEEIEERGDGSVVNNTNESTSGSTDHKTNKHLESETENDDSDRDLEVPRYALRPNRFEG